MADETNTDEQDPVVDVETARDLLNDDDQEMSDSVREELESLLEDRGINTSEEDADINPNAGEDDTRRDENPDRDWRRRTVDYFNALAMESKGGSSARKGQKKMERLEEEHEELTVQTMERENEHMEDVISRADIGKTRKDQLRQRLLYDIETRRQSTLSDSVGGHLLARPFLSELFVKIEEFGVARQELRVETVTSKSLDLKHVSSKPTVGWFNEGERITSSDMSLDEKTLDVKKLAGVTSWTTELPEDQAIAFLPTLRDAYAEQMAKKEDEAVFTGDGTSSFGGFTGIMQATTTTNTLNSGTSFSDIAKQDLIDTIQLLGQFEKQGAVWLMNDDILYDIESITEGDEVVRGINDPNHITRIFGYPVVISEAMPDSSESGSGKRYIVFGNLERAIFGDKRDMTADVFDQYTLYDSSGNVTESGVQDDSQLIRVTERVGYATPGLFEDDFVAIQTN